MPPRLSTTHGGRARLQLPKYPPLAALNPTDAAHFGCGAPFTEANGSNVICVDLRSFTGPRRVLPCFGSVGSKLCLYPLEAVTSPRLHRIIYFIVDIFNVAYFQRYFRGSIWGTTESVFALPDQLSRNLQEHIGWNRLRPFPVDIPVGVPLFRRDEPQMCDLSNNSINSTDTSSDVRLDHYANRLKAIWEGFRVKIRQLQSVHFLNGHLPGNRNRVAHDGAAILCN